MQINYRFLGRENEIPNEIPLLQDSTLLFFSYLNDFRHLHLQFLTPSSFSVSLLFDLSLLIFDSGHLLHFDLSLSSRQFWCPSSSISVSLLVDSGVLLRSWWPSSILVSLLVDSGVLLRFQCPSLILVSFLLDFGHLHLRFWPPSSSISVSFIFEFRLRPLRFPSLASSSSPSLLRVCVCVCLCLCRLQSILLLNLLRPIIGRFSA